MKKLILLTLIMFSLFTSQSYSCEPTNKTIETIDYIDYDAQSNTYYLNTVPDESNAFYVLSILQADKVDQQLLNALNSRLNGLTVEINFTGASADNIEIISFKIVNE